MFKFCKVLKLCRCTPPTKSKLSCYFEIIWCIYIISLCFWFWKWTILNITDDDADKDDLFSTHASLKISHQFRFCRSLISDFMKKIIEENIFTTINAIEILWYMRLSHLAFLPLGIRNGKVHRVLHKALSLFQTVKENSVFIT